MKKTKQRNLILSIVTESHNHPTAQEIYLDCRKTIPNISLGTVYRNLHQLEQEGIIRKVKLNSESDNYDNIIPHGHFICTNCNGIKDIFDIEKMKSIDGNVVTDYEITFKGICKECLEKGDLYGIKRK